MIQNLHIGTNISNMLPNSQIGIRVNEEFVSNKIKKMGQQLSNYYIPFQPNGINTVKVPTKTFEVFSYNFTGCFMAIWIDRLDQICIAHISTGAGQDCTGLWDRAKVNFKCFAIFKPSDYINVKFQNVDCPFVGCYGAIVCSGKLKYVDFYSITVVDYNRQSLISEIKK